MSFTPSPDFKGYAEVQAQLRQQFGRDVRFYAPAAMIYDPSITPSEFDDEGIPLDPLAGASATNAVEGLSIDNLTVVGSARVNVVANVLQSSLLRRDLTQETQLAIRSGTSRDLILDPADIPQASGATHYQVGTFDAEGNFTPESESQLWKISQALIDTFGPVERYIVYGQATR